MKSKWSRPVRCSDASSSSGTDCAARTPTTACSRSRPRRVPSPTRGRPRRRRPRSSRSAAARARSRRCSARPRGSRCRRRGPRPAWRPRRCAGSAPRSATSRARARTRRAGRASGAALISRSRAWRRTAAARRRDRRPVRRRRQPLAPARLDAGVGVQRAEAHADDSLGRVRVAGEDVPAADPAERLREPVHGLPGAQRISSGEQLEGGDVDHPVHGPGRSRSALAAGAVAVAGGLELRRDLEADRPARAGARQWRLGRWHARQTSGIVILVTWIGTAHAAGRTGR